MEHASVPEPPGLAQLAKAELIRYLQVLWDRIAEQAEALPVPESHLELAEERLSSYRKSPASARSAHIILDRLAKKQG